MRTFFSLAIDRSKAGDAIWESRVIPGTVARSPGFREYMLGRIKSYAVATPLGIESLPGFDPPQDRIDPFMTRLTKGFLRFYFPNYDYSRSNFNVRHIQCSEQNLRYLGECLVGTRYDERGDGVVRYWYGISDTGLSGVWFYMFYDSIWYLVLHARPQSSHFKID